MADAANGNGLHEAHINIEALSGEVNFLKNSQVEDRARATAFQAETRQNFDRISQQFSTAYSSLGDKIEKQGRESATSRQFSVSNFLTVSASVGGFLAIIGGALFWPIVTTQSEIARDLKETIKSSMTREDYNKDHDRNAKEAEDTRAALYNWISKVQSRQQSDEDGAVTQRQVAELKDKLDERYVEVNDRMKSIVTRVETMDANLVKRPEIQAANDAQDKQVAETNRVISERITAIVESLAALRNDFNSISPLSNVIRDLQNRVDRANNPAAMRGAE